MSPGKSLCHSYNDAVEIVVGVSGASGGGLALRFIRRLVRCREVSRLHLVISAPALCVVRDELGKKIGSPKDYVDLLEPGRAAAARIVLHAEEDVSASISSGSYPTAGMVVIPCSAGTLASIAHGISRGLLARAADVTLKERRPLVLCFRESPYSLIHIENMRAATLAGAVIMPPSPPFYIDSPSIDRLMDAYLGRVARVFGIQFSEEFVWKGKRSEK